MHAAKPTSSMKRSAAWTLSICRVASRRHQWSRCSSIDSDNALIAGRVSADRGPDFTPRPSNEGRRGQCALETRGGLFRDLSEDRREVELAGVDAANYRKVVEERARLAIVHVCSHSRQRQNVVRVMT